MNTPATDPNAAAAMPRYAHRRGTRGFAAFVFTLAGLVVLAVGTVVLPSTTFDQLVLTWVIPLTIAFGALHLVAAYGLVRRRAWSARLTGYLAAVGIGVAAYGVLAVLTGLDPFGATSKLPAQQAQADGLGLLVWMIGLWTVAARFAFRGLDGAVARPGSRPVTALDRRAPAA